MEGAKINTISKRKTLIEMYNYWTADATCKNDHVCCLHETQKKSSALTQTEPNITVTETERRSVGVQNWTKARQFPVGSRASSVASRWSTTWASTCESITSDRLLAATTSYWPTADLSTSLPPVAGPSTSATILVRTDPS